MFWLWRETARRGGYRAAAKPLLPNLRNSDPLAAPIAASIGRLHRLPGEFSSIPAAICAILPPAVKSNCLSIKVSVFSDNADAVMDESGGRGTVLFPCQGSLPWSRRMPVSTQGDRMIQLHDFKVKRRTKRLLIGAAAGVCGVPFFAILHNVFYALSLRANDLVLLSRFLAGLDVACFLLAVFVCPAAAIICLVWALSDWLAARGTTVLLRILLIAVATLAAVAAFFFLVKSGEMSTRKVDRAAGYNGSFEFVKSGYPANWYVYHRPLDDGDGEMSLDTADAVDGTRSLKFAVSKANPVGGWRSPGLFQVSDAEEGRSYRLSFWLKNRAAKIRLLITSETHESREPRILIIEIIDAERTGNQTWRQFVYTYTVPAHYANIRFEMNIVAPGTVWIDDVRIEPL